MALNSDDVAGLQLFSPFTDDTSVDRHHSFAYQLFYLAAAFNRSGPFKKLIKLNSVGVYAYLFHLSPSQPVLTGVIMYV